MVETPYSIASAGTTAHEFDLTDMGKSREHFIAGLGGSRNRPEEAIYSTVTVTAKDYDDQFREKLCKMNPPQRVSGFLDHHLNHYTKAHTDPKAFLDHFRYVILHNLERHQTTLPNTAVASDWFNMTIDNIHKQHRRERNYFLSEAYRAALKDAPEDPLSVTREPIEFGQLIGFDEATTTRIMIELVDDGLVTSSIGMGMLMVTARGRRYLDQLHGDDDPHLNPPRIVNNSYNASGGSILQVQSNSPNAVQSGNILDSLDEERTFADRLTAKLGEIEQIISAEQFATIKTDLDFLKSKLADPKSKPSLIAQLRTGILEGLIDNIPTELLVFLAGRFFQA